MSTNQRLNIFYKILLFPFAIWLLSYWTQLVFFPFYFIVFLSVFFTIIGVIAEPIVLPITGNLLASSLGAVFMGCTIYLLPLFFQIGKATIGGALAAALLLGLIEYTLHSFLVLNTPSK